MLYNFTSSEVCNGLNFPAPLVILPPSALDRLSKAVSQRCESDLTNVLIFYLAQLNVQYPMLFELCNQKQPNQKVTDTYFCSLYNTIFISIRILIILNQYIW